MVARMQLIPNEQLRKNVQDEIDFEPEITSTDISVAAEDGVVTLTGFVHNYAENLAAERAAKRIYGVKAVANDIEVKPGSVLTDPEIARNAVLALQTRVNIPDDRIKLTVKDGWVTLEGQVDWQFQKTSAESAVKNLTGVKGISNQIKLNPPVSPSQVRTKIEDALRRSARAALLCSAFWSVFVIEGGIARGRGVEIGHRSQFEVEITGGVEEGEQVVLHPTNQIADGASVEVR